MNSQFCKVGKVRFGLNEVLNLKEVEKNYLKFSEDALKLLSADINVAEFLNAEATKIKQIIRSIKNPTSPDADVAF